MTAIKSITLTRAEGIHELCGIPMLCQSWRDSDRLLREWATTVQGYCDKVDFTIDFADGEKYNGVYGLKAHDVKFTNLLGRHVRRFLQCYAGKSRPDYFSADQYERFQRLIDPALKKECLDYLAKYEIGF